MFTKNYRKYKHLIQFEQSRIDEISKLVIKYKSEKNTMTNK
ncbi:hypothetical protein OENI_20224 [Oenococcus oeni]|nr:hypothetical protein OENI_20224 [Oenococcus oeni]